MILFFDVDTQRDFMDKGGALPVPGADEIRENLRKLTEFARKKGYKVMGSVDAHYGTEEYAEVEKELRRWGGTFPDHCIKGTPGQEKIPETKPLNPLFVENRPYSQDEMRKVDEHKGEVYFEKQTYDVFDNPNLKPLVKDVDVVVIYGVATDYCVKAAAMGFRKLGKKVYLVIDGVRAVDERGGKRAVEEMEKEGVLFIRTDDVLGEAFEDK